MSCDARRAEPLHVRIPDKRVELVRGVLVVREPAGRRHSRVALNVALELGNYVRTHELGAVYAVESGLTLARGPGTRRPGEK